ncbi:MAG: hypothetical protein WCJ61_16260, partial [Paludibacter sp.]
METRENELLSLDLFFDMCILNAAVFFSFVFSSAISIGVFPNISFILLEANLSYLISYLLLSKKNLFLHDGFRFRFIRITKKNFIFILVSVFIELVIFPNSLVYLFYIVYFLIFYFGQLIFHWIKYQLMLIRKSVQFPINHTLIIGNNPTGQYLRSIIDNNPLLGFRFIGFVT